MNASPISLRVPEAVIDRLNLIAKETRRTRSSLIVEAIERFVDELSYQKKYQDGHSRFSDVIKYKGAGAKVAKPLTAEEIDTSIKEYRGDE